MELRKFRALGVVASIAVMAVATAQEQPNVTLKLTTMSTGDVLDEISKQSGVSVSTSANLRDIPLLVNVKDVPLDELLARIAHVTGTKVEKKSNGLRLVHDKAGRLKQEALERQWTTAAFERAKKTVVAKNKLPNKWTGSSVDKLVADDLAQKQRLTERLGNLENARGGRVQIFDSGMGNTSPARSSVYRVIDSIPANVLASVGPGDRVVYTTRPTRMQKRMPFLYNSIVRDFLTNHNLLASRSQQQQSDPQIEIIGSVGNTQPIQSVGKMYVILTRSQQSQNVQVQVKFADNNGLFVGDSTLSVTPEHGKVNESLSTEGNEIKLSSISREMAIIMAQELASPSSDRQVFALAGSSGGAIEIVSTGSESAPKKIPDALLSALVDPMNNEPTGFYTAEAFTQTSEALGKNLVATFHDGIVPTLAAKLVRGKFTTGGLLAASTGLGLNVEQDDNWLVVSPYWAASARATQFNRTEASKFFSRAHNRGYVSLGEMADYSFSVVTGTAQKSLDLTYLGLINKDVADVFNGYVSSNLDMLRLYGSLPMNLKTKVGDNILVATNRLPTNANGYAKRVAYRPMGGFSFMGNFGGSGGEGERTAVISMTMTDDDDQQQKPSIPANSVLKEPTESMPNGLPAQSSLVFGRTIRDAVFGTITGVRGGKFLSAGQLGMQQGMQSQGIGGNFIAGKNYDKFKLAQSAHVTLAIDLGDIGRPSANFHDGWFANGARDMAYAQLPQSFLSAVEAAKKQMANAGSLDFGGRRRTPPPVN